jgi:hypothetical protein
MIKQMFSSSLSIFIIGLPDANLDAHNADHAARLGKGTQGRGSVDSVTVSTWHPPFRVVKAF